MKHTVFLLVLLVAALSTASAAEPAPTMASARIVDAIPTDAVQVLQDPGFEIEPSEW